MIKINRIVTLVTALALLIMACGGPAAAEGQTVNILVLASQIGNDAFFPTAAAIVSLHTSEQTVKLISFCIQTQVTAVTRDAGAMSVPINFLSYCDTDEIVKAFENTFGITIDRYLIFKREYESYGTFIDVYNLFCPVTLDIPQEVMGDGEYSPINWQLQSIADVLGVDYAPVTQTGTQELDAMKVISYIAAYPAIDWDNVDWIAGTMEDYILWDFKVRAMLAAAKPKAAQMDSDAVRTLCTLITDGQETDITADDIAAWSQIPFAFADDAYLTVPGFESAEVRDFDASPLTEPGMFGHRIMAYDSGAITESIQNFVYGQN